MASNNDTSQAWAKYLAKGPTPLCERMSQRIDKPQLYLARIITAISGPSQYDAKVEGFPLVRLSDLCLGVKKMPQYRSSPRRLFAVIGTWQSDDRVWSYTLAVSTDFSENPFEDYKPNRAEAFVFTRCNLPSAYSTSVCATIQLSLEQAIKPSPIFMMGIQAQTLSTTWHMHELSETFPVAANIVSPSRLLHLFKDLGRISPDYLMLHFDLRGEMTVSERRDLTGLGRMLQGQRDIVNYIVQIGNLSLQDVKSLAGTCTALRTMLADEPSRRLQIAFAPFFPGAVPDFGAALRDHGAIIGGSTMLSIIKPGKWAPSDLDVVVSQRIPGTYESFVKFLKKQGYKEDVAWRRSAQEATTYPAVAAPLAFFGTPRRSGQFRYACFKCGSKKIDLCIVSDTPASHILTYHSSAVMNLYDGRAIFCLFPQHTFAGAFLRNACISSTPEKLDRALTKLKSRGFVEMDSTIQEWVGERGTDPYTHRLLGKNLTGVWRQAVVL